MRWARFYFDPNSLTMANNDAHFLFKGFQGTSTEVLRVEFRFSSGAYELRAALLNDASTWVNTNWFTISDAPHYIEIDWRAATAAGANDGGLTLWIDGTQQADLTGVDNDTWRVDRARLGALSSLDAGTSGTYYFDAFESRRSNYIGPIALVPSMHFASYKFVLPQQGGSLAFTPTDDAYIANGSPTNNYGSATTLQVDNSPVKHFLLKFEVTGVNGQTVTNAKIRLYNVDAASAGGNFYQVPDDSWQEETVTWNNAPTAETTLLASLGAVRPNTWYEVAVTSLVTGDGTYSFRISDSVGGADYSSKEGANDPELVITLGGTPVATNTPTNTPTPGPSPTPTNTFTPTVTPTSTATTPPPALFNNATFAYDGDGKRVKSIFNGTTTTYFVGAHYEVTGSTITKYYYADSQRIAMRTNGTLRYILGDHLGSTSLTTDANGQNATEIYYKAWGEVRYASGNTPTKHQYTGQFSYESEFGLYFYNARWYDSALGRFAQADTIIPNEMQGLDRYAYVQNNPIRYIDPTGHKNCKEDGYNCPGDNYTGTLPPGIDQEHHDRLHRLLYQAELLSLRMQEGEITDIDALRLLFEFAEVTYGDDIDGALIDLGIVVGGLDTTGIIPRQINPQDPNERLLQYYIGYPAFTPPNETSFSPELNPRNQNQVRHFLAGSAGGNSALGDLGRMILLWQEDEPEDDLLYRRAFTFVDFLATHPLSEAGSWIQENLMP